MRCQLWCLSSSVDKSSGSPVRPGQWMSPITVTYSWEQASKIYRKCDYHQQPTGSSEYRFALYVDDLQLLCDKEAPNSGEMNITGALSPRIIAVSAAAEKQTSEFNQAGPSVHRYQECHLIQARHIERRPEVHLAKSDAAQTVVLKKIDIWCMNVVMHHLCYFREQ